MIHWDLPPAWLLLIPWGWACHRLLRRRNVRGIMFSPLGRLPENQRSWRIILAGLSPWLWILGLLLLIVAVAGPQTRWRQSRRVADAVAMQMVVDVSGSMEGLDLSPRPLHPETMKTRLDVVKEVLAEFIRRRPDDLIGLTTFAGYATTRSPLTADHNALLHILREVEIPRQAGGVHDPEMLLTAIGDALASACDRLRQGEAESRIIILFSDGESNTGILEPETAAGIAVELGIRVYVIGIGTDEPVPYATHDAFDRPTVATAPVTYDEELLKHIAQLTGGVYYNAGDTEGLEEALASINQLETTKVEHLSYFFINPLFLPWAAAACFLILTAAASGLWMGQQPA